MPKDPTGNVVRNLFTIRQLENSLVKEVDDLLLALFEDISDQLARAGASSSRAARLRRLLDQITELVGPAFDEIHKLSRQRIAQIGSVQADFAEDVLKTALSGVGVDIRPNRIGVNFLKRIVDQDTIRGHLLEDWFTRQGEKVAFQVQREIQLGLAQNETIDDMVRRIRGRQAGFLRQDPATGQFVAKGTKGAIVQPRFSGGVLSTSTREAEALVRTATNQVVSTAHMETYSANQDITQEYEYVATLDSRTTEICMGLDGRTFRYDDENRKEPPQHWNCRSTIIPRVNWAALGIEAPPEGMRASADGPVKASTTYQKWLKDQPAAMQDEILGPGRAKLFRSGKITLRDLVGRDNRRLRLDELERKAA